MVARPAAGVAQRPCHQRAIHSGHDRSPTDTHGQQHRDLDLHMSLPSQVTSLPDLALGAGGRLVEACIGLAVPGRPIGPWSRRTGAPKASATGRDRKPPLVRAGSAADGQTMDNSGHERALTDRRNRRSSDLQAPDLWRRRRPQWSSSLPTQTSGRVARAQPGHPAQSTAVATVSSGAASAQVSYGCPQSRRRTLPGERPCSVET